MLERLFPREGNEFYEYFESHAEKTVEAAQVLRDLLATPAEAKALAAKVKQLEHEGDEITHRTIAALHQSFLAPLERGDIHSLISRLDDVLDLIDSTAERLWLYEIRTMEPEVHALAEVLERATLEVQRAVLQLRRINDTGSILAVCKEITRREKEADRLMRQAMARLFESGRDAIHVMMWKEIYHFLEDAIDRCEDVGDVLEGIALEYA